ncbi:MAG: hypothetical protein P9M15_07325, partial [Candidatus Electryoneaceae bacterium]|nr:hypothetical protein [Candidatus Electryoneaceae bacterium]
VHLYDAGRIAEAEYMALHALDTQENLSRYNRFNLHKVLAFCAIANDDETGGIRQFTKALQLNPAMTSDPMNWSPKVREIFHRAREEYDRQEAINQLYHITTEANLCRRASLKSLYLPGAGQMMKGHKKRAVIIGTVFTGAVAAFIYTQVALPSARNRYRQATLPDDIDRYWNDYSNLYHVANISGIVVTGVYLYAFFDALWNPPVPSPSLPTEQTSP